MAASSLHQLFRTAIVDLERDFDTIGDFLDEGEDRDSKVRLLAHAGDRNANAVRIRGRIVRYAKPLDAGKGLLSRMRAMLAIYSSQELPGVNVRIDGYSQTHY